MRQISVSFSTQRKQSGFVLLLTLWIMVIVALAAGYFSDLVSHSVELALKSSKNTRAIIDMAGSRAEILYRLSTTSITEFGLGRGNALIKLDNSPYYGLGGTIIQLQDNRGLFNLNYCDDETLQLFLGILGIPMKDRGHLIDTLRDYTDMDDLTRLNGAEKREYLALNLPPPPNRNLVTPWEVQRIIGWRDAPQLWKNGRLANQTTTSITIAINPNTASAEVLAALPGVTPEIAQAIVEKRKLLPLSLGQYLAMTTLPDQQYEFKVFMLPSNSIRITQHIKELPWAVQYNITLTPNANDAPWRTDYYSRVRSSQPDEMQVNIQDLPPRSTSLPDKMPVL